MKIKLTLLLLFTIFLSGCNNKQQELVATPSPTSTSKEEVKMEIDTSKIYQAILKTTQGNITIELNTKKTPITANNFITLAKKNFYDKTIFHRVIKGFMIQGGDPTGTGRGGESVWGKPFEDEFNSKVKFDSPGVLAMANAGPNTNGSQFFIMHADYPLDKKYVIFGKVVEGLDVVDKIATSPVTTNPSGESSKPVTSTAITSVEIIEK